jgi:hypothetical protein
MKKYARQSNCRGIGLASVIFWRVSSIIHWTTSIKGGGTKKTRHRNAGVYLRGFDAVEWATLEHITVAE